MATKAEYWAEKAEQIKQMESERPCRRIRSIGDTDFYFGVDNLGRLEINNNWTFSPEWALQLGEFLVATFGERPNDGSSET